MMRASTLKPSAGSLTGQGFDAGCDALFADATHTDSFNRCLRLSPLIPAKAGIQICSVYSVGFWRSPG
jgi:hypothetical protein